MVAIVLQWLDFKTLLLLLLFRNVNYFTNLHIFESLTNVSVIFEAFIFKQNFFFSHLCKNQQTCSILANFFMLQLALICMVWVLNFTQNTVLSHSQIFALCNKKFSSESF